MSVRTFIALELSEAAKAGILAVIRELHAAGVRASWARSSTIHLTLRFLGDVEERRLEDVVTAARRAAASTAAFDVSTSRLGAFPSPRRPRVIWVGVEAPNELYELRDSIESELAALGFERESRRFHPHVTLGRIRAEGADLTRLLGDTAVPEEGTRVRCLRVMKSTLASAGAIHEVVEELPLEQLPLTEGPGSPG